MVFKPQHALQQRACIGISPNFPCSALRPQNWLILLKCIKKSHQLKNKLVRPIFSPQICGIPNRRTHCAGLPNSLDHRRYSGLVHWDTISRICACKPAFSDFSNDRITPRFTDSCTYSNGYQPRTYQTQKGLTGFH